MPYADSDFFVALLKPRDWLREPAHKVLAAHKGSLWTSPWTIAEVMFVAKEFGIDAERVIVAIYELANVRGLDRAEALAAAHFVERTGLSVFDALHAAACGADAIVSSDRVFDKLGMRRIPLR